VSSSHPPKEIVMTRLNTVGLKRLAEGSLVEKSPFESRPPERRSARPPEPQVVSKPATQPPPPVTPIPVKLESSPVIELDELDELTDAGADAEDPTVMLGAEGGEDRTLAAPAHAAPAAFVSATPKLTSVTSSAPPPAPRKKSDPPSLVVDPRLELETPTTMFVKDIQATLKEELHKQQKQAEVQRRAELATAATQPESPVFSLPPLDIAPLSESAHVGKRQERDPDQPTKIQPRPELSKSVPVPPTSKPASLAPPPAKVTSSLPAPLPAQANRRKDPIGVSVTNRPPKIQRRGGFVPWAAALTALGVFVGVAGARIAMGAPFIRGAVQAQTAPAAAPGTPAAEPGFAPRVIVPTDNAAPVAEAKPVETTKAVETKPAEEKPAGEKAKPTEAEKPVAKAEPVETKSVETKSDHIERPRVVRRERPAPEPKPERIEKPEPKPEPVAARPKPERVEKPEKAEKPEPAPKKSSDVAAAARDYAAVESQLGQSL
jgi:hypothetical protein